MTKKNNRFQIYNIKIGNMENLLGPAVMNHQDISMALTKQILMSAKPQRQGAESPMEQLNLIFKKDDSKDINELRQILGGEVLKYPSSELANIHMKANRIGEIDLKQNQSGLQFQEFIKNMGNPKICSCCGFFMQENTVPICTDIGDVGHMGISTFLYFETLKNIVGLLTIMFVILSIYAIISNVVASNQYKDIAAADLAPNLLSFQGFLAISLGSKQINETQGDRISYTIQCWLGVGVIVIWMIAFGIIKQRQRTRSIQVDQESKSAADYTILIKNLPENMTKQQLEVELEAYKAELTGKNYLHFSMKSQIKINKINKAKPFYLEEDSFEDDQLDRLNKQYQGYRLKYIKWIEERQNQGVFSASEQQREKTMKQFLQIKADRKKRYEEIARKVVNQLKQKGTEGTVPAFITFQNSHNKQFLDFMHDDMKNIFNVLPCFTKDKYFHFTKQNSHQKILAQVRPASEPQDIIWTNLGQTYSEMFKKKLLTYFVSLMALGASFGAIYGLSKVQFDYAKQNTGPSNQYISILISLCISIINIILQQILRFLTKLERSSTNTQHQTSLALKAVLALLINSILIPILVNYFFKENLFGVNGLAYDVFYLGITNSFLSPILKIFDIYYYFTRFWRWYKDHPNRKLYLNQNQLNTISQYMEFQIGYEYIYIVNLYLFTCFFAPLQPIIVIFAIFGLIMMFWAQKYSLFNRCQRPFTGRKLLNSTMYQIIYFGPAFYTIGSFCWSHFFTQNFIGIAPNLVAAILSAIILILPYNKVSKIFYDDIPEPDRKFYNERIFMPSEYDRLNPHTAEQGIKDYKRYLIEFKNYIGKNDPEQAKNIERQFLMQYGNGVKRQNLILPSVVTYLTPKNSGAYSENQLIMQELFGTNQNVINPFIIGHTMLNNQNQLNIPIQNWLTNEESQVVTYAQNNNKNNQNNGNSAFSYNLTNSIMLPNTGQAVTYQVQPQRQSNSADIKIIYDGLLGSVGKNNKMGNNQSQNQRASIQVPLNVPVNIFQMLGKFSEENIPKKQEPKRFQTNNNQMGRNPHYNQPLPPINRPPNNANLFEQIVKGNGGLNSQQYDPYSINLNSEGHLNQPYNMNQPFNMMNPMSPQNQYNNPYGRNPNPYGNNSYGNGPY